MIKSKSGKEITSIYIRDGKEIIEVRDNQNNIVYSAIDEISGSVPLSFMSRGGCLRDYRIYGNTVQNGTPTPETPVEVQGCGEYDVELNGYKIPVTVSGENLATLIQGSYDSNGEPNTNGNRVKTPLLPVEYGDVFVMALNKWYFRNVAFFDESKTFIKFGNDISIVPYIYADVQNAKYISVILGDTKTGQGNNISPNYSPFRLEYKPITTPVYIGSEPLHKIDDYADYVDFKRGVVVRRIKKLVTTGEENWVRYALSAESPVERFTLSCGARPVTIISLICSHFIVGDGTTGARFGGNYHDVLFFHIDKTIASTVDEFKRYLQSQYSSGTPVTVWYVLATPEEEPLENLLPIQTIKGSDVLTADTTVQPSEMYIKGKIKSIT